MNPSIKYNIELKSSEKGGEILHPVPIEFSDLVMAVLKDYNLGYRLTIQSFDVRILQHFHEQYPELKLAYFIENSEDIEKNLELLGFAPEIYSCYIKLLDKERLYKVLVVP
jgi:glycerophosphoryl diester phosphodiesterase